MDRAGNLAGEFDFIVVGSGSAGSVLAARLSEDARVRVLLLEAGPGRTPLASRVPVAFSRLFQTRYDWAYRTEPEPALNGRRLFVPRGKLLGGSSAINAMIYIRGNAADYDGWAALGAEGWSYTDVLPYFIRAEDQARGASALHGVGGPLRVEDLRCKNPLSEAFVEACVATGVARNPDFNGASQKGAGFYQVTQKDGRRWSAADAYLFPALGRPNLTLKAGAQVVRLLLDGDRARGVEWREGRRVRSARAAQEVILCAGVFGSPQILMLSGIGDAAELRRLGVQPALDLPGVGLNLQDHPIVGSWWTSTRPISLNNARRAGALLQYLRSRSGPLTSNVAEAGAFVASPQADGGLPDIQYHFAPVLFIEHGFQEPREHGFSIGPTLLTPRSRGRVWLGSSDPAEPVRISGNHLMEERDRRTLAWGIELGREIAGARPFDRYRGREYFPGGQPRPDDLDTLMRQTVELLYHPSGTCRMGGDAASVVDPRLCVRGIRALRVADASVMPVIPRGNPHAAVVMIAERLAAWLRAGDDR